MDRLDRGHRIASGSSGERHARRQVFGEQLTNGMELRRVPTSLADGRVIVITGQLGVVGTFIGSGMEAKAGASVRHVEIERSIVAEHPMKRLDQARVVAAARAAATPTIKPTCVTLPAQE